jgi:hypothetical protein
VTDQLIIDAIPCLLLFSILKIAQECKHKLIISTAQLYERSQRIAGDPNCAEP